MVKGCKTDRHTKVLQAQTTAQTSAKHLQAPAPVALITILQGSVLTDSTLQMGKLRQREVEALAVGT